MITKAGASEVLALIFSSFIHPFFPQILVKLLYVLGTVLGAGDTTVYKTMSVLPVLLLQRD